MVAVNQLHENPYLNKYAFKEFNDFILTPEMDTNCMQPNDDILSSPHSNAFLDIDGDCIPDLFLQKTKKVVSEGKTTFYNYFEIYITKNVNETNMYCLVESGKSLTRQKPQEKIEDVNVPLIQFNDFDRDGMLDLLFYHENEIHIHFNLLIPKSFNTYSIKDSGESLCYRSNETAVGLPIFADINEMSSQDYLWGGTN